MPFDASTAEGLRPSLIFPARTRRDRAATSPTTFTTTTFSQCSCGWFGASPRRATPEGQTTSIASTAPTSAGPPSTNPSRHLRSCSQCKYTSFLGRDRPIEHAELLRCGIWSRIGLPGLIAHKSGKSQRRCCGGPDIRVDICVYISGRASANATVDVHRPPPVSNTAWDRSLSQLRLRQSMQKGELRYLGFLDWGAAPVRCLRAAKRSRDRAADSEQESAPLLSRQRNPVRRPGPRAKANHRGGHRSPAAKSRAANLLDRRAPSRIAA
jgi:hypothetical protein